MKFLVDMNLSPRWVDALASEGFQAAHWSTLGKANAADVDIMAFARTHGYIVLTHDLDFSAILAATQGLKPSVIQIRAEQTGPEFIAARIIAAITAMSDELEQGALLSVEPDRGRIRTLPL